MEPLIEEEVLDDLHEFQDIITEEDSNFQRFWSKPADGAASFTL